MIKRILIAFSLFFTLVLVNQEAFSQKTPSKATSGQSATEPADSVKLDTVVEKKVEPKTEWVSPEDFFRMVEYRKPSRAKLPDFQYFDELERLPGFSVGLGQTGKPYRRYLYGVSAALYPTGNFINPIMGTENVYMYNLEGQIPHYDTRTPYVNVRYDMGGRALNIINGEVSVNATPFVNIAVGYKSRKVEGAYSNNETADYNLYFSNHIHTFNNRYQAFVSAVYNEQKDAMNGGTYSTIGVDSSFNKAFQDVVLSGNLMRRFHRGARVLQMFRVNKDSSKSPHRFQVLADVLTDRYDYSLTDETFPFTVTTLPVPGYVTLDSTTVYESAQVARFKAKGAASYRFEKGGFYLGARGGFQYERKGFRQVGKMYKVENRLGNFVEGEIGLKTKPLEVDGFLNYRNSFSDLFQAENLFHVGGQLSLGPRMYDYVKVNEEKLGEGKDRWYEFASHLPFQLSGEYLVNAKNPSYFQMFYIPASWNHFTSNPLLRNQLLNHVKVGAAFTGRTRRKGDEPYPAAPMVGLNGFISNLGNAIFYDDSLNILQAPQGQSLTWTGLELKFRLRAGKFYLQNETTYQVSFAGDSTDLDIYYNRYIPQLFGKTAIFYETRETKIARALRAGVEFHYRSGYEGLFFDTGTQEWYAQRFLFGMPGYVRADVFLNLQIKRVHLHFRLVHANEGLLLPGYYDTPYHPALERTFILGLNWNFFD